MNSKLRIIPVLTVVCLAGGVLWGNRTQAQQSPAHPSPLYVLTFIDLLPPGLAPGTEAIKQYVEDTRHDAGNQRCEAVAQVAGRANHLMIIEVWKDQKALDKHQEAKHTLDFRSRLAPLVGAPFDQRVSFLVA